jgi:hypothetical protein
MFFLSCRDVSKGGVLGVDILFWCGFWCGWWVSEGVSEGVTGGCDLCRRFSEDICFQTFQPTPENNRLFSNRSSGWGWLEGHVRDYRIPRTYQVYIILKKILGSSGIKTESVSEMAKGFPPGLRLLYSSGFERHPSRFGGMHALDR